MDGDRKKENTAKKNVVTKKSAKKKNTAKKHIHEKAKNTDPDKKR